MFIILMLKFLYDIAMIKKNAINRLYACEKKEKGIGLFIANRKFLENFK